MPSNVIVEEIVLAVGLTYSSFGTYFLLLYVEYEKVINSIPNLVAMERCVVSGCRGNSMMREIFFLSVECNEYKLPHEYYMVVT